MKKLLALAIILTLALCACSGEEIPPPVEETSSESSSSTPEDIPPEPGFGVFDGKLTSISDHFPGDFSYNSVFWLSENELAVEEQGEDRTDISIMNFGTGEKSVVASNVATDSHLVAAYNFGDFWKLFTWADEYDIRKGDYYIERIYNEDNSALKFSYPSPAGDKIYRGEEKLSLFTFETGGHKVITEGEGYYGITQQSSPWSLGGRYAVFSANTSYEPDSSDICVYDVRENTCEITRIDAVPVIFWSAERENTFYLCYKKDGGKVIERRFTDFDKVETRELDFEFNILGAAVGERIYIEAFRDGGYELGALDFESGEYEKLLFLDRCPYIKINPLNGNAFISLNKDGKFLYESPYQPAEPYEHPLPEEPEWNGGIPDYEEYLETTQWEQKSAEDYSAEEIEYFLLSYGRWFTEFDLFTDPLMQVEFDREYKVIKRWLSLSDEELEKAAEQSSDFGVSKYKLSSPKADIYILFDRGAYISSAYYIWRSTETGESKLIYISGFRNDTALLNGDLLVINNRTSLASFDMATGEKAKAPFDFPFGDEVTDGREKVTVGLGYDEAAGNYVAVYEDWGNRGADEYQLRAMLAIYSKDGSRIKTVDTGVDVPATRNGFFVMARSVEFPAPGEVKITFPNGSKEDIVITEKYPE